MNYWVIKGNPSRYDWDKDLRLGCVEPWVTRFFHPNLAVNDRLFLWESGNRRRVIGLGEVTEAQRKRNRNGLCPFKVRYLTSRLQVMPRIDEFRKMPVMRSAAFLNPGPFGTLYPLSSGQARALYRVVIANNRDEHIWRDLVVPGQLPQAPESEPEALEGNAKLLTHLIRERDPSLAREKKRRFQRQHRKLFCEVCGRDHGQYGRLAENVFEVHHTQPLGQRTKAEETKLSDLSVVCSNCHRAIHRTKPMCSVSAFKRLISR